MEIGIQVSSLKPLLCTAKQVRSACEEIRRLSCNTVQLQWVDPSVPIAEIAHSLRDNQIQSVSVQDLYETVVENLAYYTQLNAATGGIWLCVSRIPERCKSPSGLDVFVSELRLLQDKLTPLGQRLCFHPVRGDYCAVAGMDAVAYILERMPQLYLCLDLYHLYRSRIDMPGYIRQYGPRICMVHFKDGKGETLVPAGQGDTDWTGVVRACLDARIPYGFVEQERWEGDPYTCLGEAMLWLSQEMQQAT